MWLTIVQNPRLSNETTKTCLREAQVTINLSAVPVPFNAGVKRFARLAQW